MNTPTHHPNTLKRGKFIQWLALGAAAIGTPALIFNYSNLLKPDASVPEDELLELVGGPTVNAIGQSWLKKFPQENDANALKKALTTGSKIPSFDNAGIQELVNHLKSASRTDFRNFNTAIIEGWVLAKSDCRVCALYYLKQLQKK